MNPLDPTTYIDFIKFLVKSYKAWKGFKLIIFGTTGVGKTTLWYYLQKNQIVPESEVNKTLEINHFNKFRLRSISLGFTKVGVLATDVPGDIQYRNTWKEALEIVKPDGIIFMIDNVHYPDDGIPTIGYDKKRLEDHKIAYDYLMELLLENNEVSRNLQAIAIVANKSDTFTKEMGGIGKLIKEADLTHSINVNQYGQLHHCRTTAFTCSAKYGENVHFMMEWMVKNMIK